MTPKKNILGIEYWLVANSSYSGIKVGSGSPESSYLCVNGNI